MRVELQAIKTAIEVAMYYEIDDDETVPADIIDAAARLHSAICQHEKE